MAKDSIEVFDWQRILYSEDIPKDFLGEIGIRTTLMFLVLIIALKFLSKRGVKQLSVFELAILIALGSATGDPMFYHHVPLTYGIVVIIVVILLYRLITGLTGRSRQLEVLLEGKPILLLENGRILFENYKKVGLPYDKFFAELRLRSVDHLGQVKKAYLETSGDISVYLFADEEVRAGLPIFPELLLEASEDIGSEASSACIHCGHVQTITKAGTECEICRHNQWISAKSNKRVH